MDDVLCYSPSLEQHLKDVREVLAILRQERLYVKASKCEFGRSELGFLGHRVADAGHHLAQHLTDTPRNPPVNKAERVDGPLAALFHFSLIRPKHPMAGAIHFQNRSAYIAISRFCDGTQSGSQGRNGGEVCVYKSQCTHFDYLSLERAAPKLRTADRGSLSGAMVLPDDTEATSGISILRFFSTFSICATDRNSMISDSSKPRANK
jgi:hypothetical protein